MPSPSTLFELRRTRFAMMGPGSATRSLLAKRGGRTRDRTLDLSRVKGTLAVDIATNFSD